MKADVIFLGRHLRHLFVLDLSQFHFHYGVYYNRNHTTVVIFIVIVKEVLLKGLPKIWRGQWRKQGNLFMSREGDFQRHFVCVFFARRPRKNFARELHEMAQFVLKIVHLTTFVFRWKQPHYSGTQFNEGPRGWQNLFTLTRFRYIEVIFHIFHYYWSKENCSLYRGLRYIEVRYIEVPPRWKRYSVTVS